MRCLFNDSVIVYGSKQGNRMFGHGREEIFAVDALIGGSGGVGNLKNPV